MKFAALELNYSLFRHNCKTYLGSIAWVSMLGAVILVLLANHVSSSLAPPLTGIQGYFSRVKGGFTGQYENFQECQRIRKARKVAPEKGLNYEEYELLRVGSSDKWKIVSLGLYTSFSPEFVMFMAVMPSFWPRMLPSTFTDNQTKENQFLDRSKQRYFASLEGIKDFSKAVDKEIQEATKKGESKNTASKKAIHQIESILSVKTKQEAIQSALPLLQISEEPTKKELKKMPKPLLYTLSKCLGIEGVEAFVMRRGKVSTSNDKRSKIALKDK